MATNKRKLKIANVLAGAKESAKNYFKAGVGNARTYLRRNRVANGMMRKEYVSPTMGNRTWDQRKKDIKPLIRAGEMSQARQYLRNKKRLFNIANSTNKK